jgi:hypothetical protein
LATTNIETNLKDYYLTLFDVILQDTSYNQATVLYDMDLIASQCPFEGGPAVYLARNLISLVDTLRIYNDQSICYGARYGIESGPEIEPDNIIASKVYPNPFKEGFIISLFGLNKVEYEINIIIHDLTGRLIWNEQTKSSNFPHEINFKDRNSGIYFLELINTKSNERISSHKIIQLE